MKPEKKEKIIKNQESRSIRARNKKINRFNLLILATGLLLIVLEQDMFASIFIWTGVAIGMYTISSSILAHRSKI